MTFSNIFKAPMTFYNKIKAYVKASLAFRTKFQRLFSSKFQAPLAFSSKFKAPATFSSNSFDQVKRFQCQEQQIQGQRVVNSTSVED